VADARAAAVAAVLAVRDEAITTLRETETQYADLQAEAAALEPIVQFAHALMNPEEETWLDVTREQWIGLLRQFQRYLTRRADPEAPPTEDVSEAVHNRTHYPYSYGRVRLTDLVDWLVAGLYRKGHDAADADPAEH
jgi:hypothetical protein